MTSESWPEMPFAGAVNLPVAGDIADALSRGAFDDARRMARTALRAPDLGAEKILSRKHRCLWICTPKVASRSIMAALRSAIPDAEVILQMGLRDLFATRPETRDYYSFAFVRHPFHRTLSFYREVFFSPKIYADTYHRYQGKEERCVFDPVAGRSVLLNFPLREAASPAGKAQKGRGLFELFYGLEETTSFDDVCRWLNTPYGSDAFAERHFLSQHVQIRLPDGRLPDFIGRLENLDADLRRVATHLGMPALPLPMLNTMAGWQPTPEALQSARETTEVGLSERNRALLKTRYAGDLDLFGYSPD